MAVAEMADLVRLICLLFPKLLLTFGPGPLKKPAGLFCCVQFPPHWQLHERAHALPRRHRGPLFPQLASAQRGAQQGLGCRASPRPTVADPPQAPSSTSNPPATSASAPSPRAAAQPEPARTAPSSARSYPFASASQASTGRDGDAPVCDGTSVDDKYGSSCFGSRGLMNAQMYSAKTAAQR